MQTLTHTPTSERAQRRLGLPLWLFALFVGAAWLGVWFLITPSIGTAAYFRPAPARSTYEFSRQIVLLFIPYGLALWAWRRGSRVPLWMLLGGALLLHVLVLFAPLPQSQDFYQYLFYGKMQAAYGANPYVVHPAVFNTDAWYGWIRWRNQTSVYGPVWTLLSFGVAKVAGNSLALAFVGMKLVVLALDGAVMWLMVRLARGQADEHGVAGFGLLAWAWNPLILITVPLGGVADVAIAAAFLGAILARKNGRTGVATVLLALATLVKVYAGIGLILHLVLLARERDRRTALRHGGLAAAVAAVTYAPYWAGWATFRGFLNVIDLSNKSLVGTIQRLLLPVLRAAGVDSSMDVAAAIVRWIVAPLMLAVVVWAWRRVRDEDSLWQATLMVLAVYLFLTPWFLYWYMVAPLALVAMLPESRLTVPLLTFSGTAIIDLRFYPWLLGQVAQTVARYAPPVLVYGRRPFRRRAEARSGGVVKIPVPAAAPLARGAPAAK
jgi:glycosyl transferase family 87